MGAFFLMLFLLVYGAICAISPETGWYLSKGWQFKDAEPSESMLKYIRVSGFVQIGAAFYILFTL